MNLEILGNFKDSKSYIEITLENGKVLDGFITRITWDDLEDIVYLRHPLTKIQSTISLRDIVDVSILKP